MRSAALLSGAAFFLAIGPAQAAWMVPPTPIRPKDFTLLKRDGVYHLFYIRNNPSLPASETQVDFGHATSPDLFFWQQQPPVLPVRPGLFDQAHVWAPSIVLRDSVYTMFYTGVADSFPVRAMDQRIGLATSTDLMTWNRLDLPVLSCDQVPWAWCDTTGASPFRDPFVMPDPTTPGRWLMYYSGAPASDPPSMIVGVASSDGDFTAWQDLTPLWITHHSWTFNDVVESPHVFEHDGLWFLMFTSNSGQPISFMTSPNPLSPPLGWSYKGRLSNMILQDTQGWFASEYLRDGLVEYFAFVNGDRIDVQRMQWHPDDTFSLVQPDLFHVQSLSWLSPSVRPGQYVTLRIQSRWGFGRQVPLEAFWLDEADVWHPIPMPAIGIPAQIQINSDVMNYNWLARAIPPLYGAPPNARLILRLTDQTATSNALELLPIQGGDPGDPPPDLEPVDDSEPFEPLVKRGPKAFRAVESALGAVNPSVLVELFAPASARLDVYDLQGRRVANLADRELPAGATVMSWNGRDALGRRMSRGLYFVRLVTPGVTRTARILLR